MCFFPLFSNFQHLCLRPALSSDLASSYSSHFCPPVGLCPPSAPWTPLFCLLPFLPTPPPGAGSPLLLLKDAPSAAIGYKGQKSLFIPFLCSPLQEDCSKELSTLATALPPLCFSLEPSPPRLDPAPPKEPLLVEVTEHLMTHGVTKRKGQLSVLTLSELTAVLHWAPKMLLLLSLLPTFSASKTYSESLSLFAL